MDDTLLVVGLGGLAAWYLLSRANAASGGSGANATPNTVDNFRYVNGNALNNPGVQQFDGVSTGPSNQYDRQGWNLTEQSQTGKPPTGWYPPIAAAGAPTASGSQAQTGNVASGQGGVTPGVRYHPPGALGNRPPMVGQGYYNPTPGSNGAGITPARPGDVWAGEQPISAYQPPSGPGGTDRTTPSGTMTPGSSRTPVNSPSTVGKTTVVHSGGGVSTGIKTTPPTSGPNTRDHRKTMAVPPGIGVNNVRVH